jgi:uncharacterized protein (TIGR03435 family)
MLLMRAYKVKSQEIFAPGWMETARFNIVAKLPQTATREQVALMFRNLLAERFQVVLHREYRLVPVYALTVAKGGLKMKETSPAPAAADEAPPAGPPRVGDDGFPILRSSVFAGGAVILYRQGRARLQAGNIEPVGSHSDRRNRTAWEIRHSVGLDARRQRTRGARAAGGGHAGA